MTALWKQSESSGMNKKIIVLIVAVLIVAVPLTVVGLVTNAYKPAKAEGGFFSDIVDRVKIEVDKTDFIYAEVPYTESEFSFNLTLSKTEAEFYCYCEQVEIEGMDYNSVVFEAVGDTPSASPEGLILEGSDDGPLSYTWRVTVTTDDLPDEATLRLILTSGMSALTAETRITDIPLSFAVE